MSAPSGLHARRSQEPACVERHGRAQKRTQPAASTATAMLHFLFNWDPSFPAPSARSKGAVAGSEPADAIRAVNALLTRLDQLKAAPNVMVRCMPVI